MDDELRTLEAGYRRETLPDPEAVGEDEDLVELLRAEIGAGGPITFARFMDRALYEPGHGYYRRPAAEPGGESQAVRARGPDEESPAEPGRGPAGPGREGDFLTAPEAHPIFGAAVGSLLEQAWEAMGRPAPFTVTEQGAGTGALAAGLLGGLRDLGSPLLGAVRYRPVELEADGRRAIEARLAAGGLAGSLAVDGPPEDRTETGAVVANEVLDALPVHRVVGRPAGVAELLVGLDETGRFVHVEAPLTDPALARRLAEEGVALEDGQVTEVCLALDDWLGDAARHLARGVIVLVDYAEEPGTLHAPARRDGTLRAFARHAVGGDPFRHVGRQDLTATVDLAAVRSAATRAGLDPIGETTQAELLAAVGSGALAEAFLRRPGGSLAGALALRSGLARLMDTRGMGGFRVLVYGRGLPAGTRLEGLRRLAPDRP